MIELLVGLAFAAVAAVILQVMSGIAAVVDAARVRDSDEPDAVTRGRMRELLWTLAVLAAVAVFVAFGVDVAARLAWDLAQPGWSLAVLLLTALAAFLAGAAVVGALVARERPTYARLRRDLRDRDIRSMEAEVVAEFEARLERADVARTRRPRARLALKIFGLALVVTAAALFVGAYVAMGSPLWGLVVALAALHVVAFVVDVRAGAVYRTRLEAVLDAQRAEVVALLERARIPARATVPGLRDRVSRALAILREKQR